MTYRDEFPDFDYVLPSIPGMADISWHNDAMPLLSGHGLHLWCDYLDESKREFTGGSRFMLATDDDERWIATSDSIDDIATTTIRAILDGMTSDNARRAYLSAAYTATVGYDIFADDSEATIESAATLLAEMISLHFNAANGNPI